MRTAPWSVVLAASVLGVLGASGGQRPAEIAVPEGNGVPVITDGIFSPGEWDDAHRSALTASVQLYVKQHRGVVFIGVRGLGSRGRQAGLARPSGGHPGAGDGRVAIPAPRLRPETRRT